MNHVIPAVVVQIVLWLLFGNAYYAGAVAVSYFVGREIAQAEYKWIEHYGHGMRANMKWSSRFDKRVWDAHSLLNWAGPLLVCTCVGTAIHIL